MIDKIKTLLATDFVQSFKDVRFVGFVVFGIMVLLVSWSGVSVIESNYVLQKKVTELEQQNRVAELENSNLELQNEYYNSPQYLELTARRQFGLGLPGETLVLVPKTVALKYTKDIPEETKSAVTTPTVEKTKVQQNIDAWMDFFLRRGTLDN